MADRGSQSTHGLYRIADRDRGDLLFDSDFEGGNCARVEQAADDADAFHVWIAADCEDTPHATRHRAWFHFSVGGEGARSGRAIRITVMNMSKMAALFRSGMCPVFRAAGDDRWARTARPRHCLSADGRSLQLTFRHTFGDHPDATAPGGVFFAFAEPFSYARLLRRIDELELAAGSGASVHADVETGAADTGNDVGAGAGTSASASASASKSRDSGQDPIEFRRELLCTTPLGRRVDMLCITANDGSAPEPERKPIVLITARVHPSETPASFCCDALLSALLGRSAVARALRRTFDFRVVPMLNPDGVALGHARCCAAGHDLNRCYGEAMELVLSGSGSDSTMPQIVALCSLVARWRREGRLCAERGAVVDMHAHTQKRGVFVYGNELRRWPAARKRASRRLAVLLERHCPVFEYGACVFDDAGAGGGEAARAVAAAGKAKGPPVKNGAGRRVFGERPELDLTYCYTLECNFHGGRRSPAPFCADTWEQVA
eukprot:g4378.t1